MVLPAALPGIITGIVLALARIAGETAPLLFTSFNNRFFSTNLVQPISSLTVQVYTYAISPYEDWHRQAWAGALVLVGIVLLCSLLARLATARMERMTKSSSVGLHHTPARRLRGPLAPRRSLAGRAVRGLAVMPRATGPGSDVTHN